MKALELAGQAEKTASNRLDSDLEEWALSAEIDLRACAKKLRRLAAVEADCAPYLKEGETPAERIKRALADADSLMSLYRDVVAERDSLKAENASLEEMNTQLREQNDAVGEACAKYEAELERIKALEPVAWLVLSTNQDGSISVEYVAEWPEAAHEHINDAISEHDDKEAASWVVRPVIYALGSKTA